MHLHNACTDTITNIQSQHHDGEEGREEVEVRAALLKSAMMEMEQKRLGMSCGVCLHSLMFLRFWLD
jgi:hypothetical protein